MHWFPTLSKSGYTFHSVIAETDEASTGKWIVSIPRPDESRLWEELEDAAVTGLLPAVKKSRDHTLACVYCERSTDGAVYETLLKLREIGIEGELHYKSDRATDQRRDEYLWSSSDFEQLLSVKPF